MLRQSYDRNPSRNPDRNSDQHPGRNPVSPSSSPTAWPRAVGHCIGQVGLITCLSVALSATLLVGGSLIGGNSAGDSGSLTERNSLGATLLSSLSAESAQAAPAKSSTTQQKIRELKRSKQRWIQVDLTKQRVIAWNGNRWVDAMIVSTGKGSTPTPTGVYEIYVKYREARMQGDDYDIPDVPHVMYFSGGYGFHGAYWHNNFGTPVSHGCINLAVDKAKWLYNFASVGTPIVIHR